MVVKGKKSEYVEENELSFGVPVFFINKFSFLARLASAFEVLVSCFSFSVFHKCVGHIFLRNIFTCI